MTIARTRARLPVSTVTAVVALICFGPGPPAHGQVARDSGPLAEITVRRHSQPVHDRSRSMRDNESRSLTSGPVRDARVRSMTSGPISEISRGPVRAGLPPGPVDGSIGNTSTGSVKLDIDRPIGERISDPLHELHPLRSRLRELGAAAPHFDQQGIESPSDDSLTSAPVYDPADIPAEELIEPEELPANEADLPVPSDHGP